MGQAAGSKFILLTGVTDRPGIDGYKVKVDPMGVDFILEVQRGSIICCSGQQILVAEQPDDVEAMMNVALGIIDPDDDDGASGAPMQIDNVVYPPQFWPDGPPNAVA